VYDISFSKADLQRKMHNPLRNPPRDCRTACFYAISFSHPLAFNTSPHRKMVGIEHSVDRITILVAKSGAQLYFDDSMLVVAGAGIAAEDRDSFEPHDHPDRDQVNAGQHKPHGAVDALRHRIAQKSRIGNKNTVSQALLPVRLHVSVGDSGIKHAHDLHAHRDQKDHHAVPQRAVRQLLHKGRDNIAWKYHVDHKVRDALLPFAADDPLFAGHKPDPDQREYDKLKPQHSDHT